MIAMPKDEKSFAKLFDNSMLKATNKQQEYVTLCEDALAYGFSCIAVNGAFIKFCADILKGSDVRLTCATSFPLGICTLETKVHEMNDAISNGATDIDLVLNISKILDHEYAYIEKEIETCVTLCKKANVVSKIIFETTYLSDDEIVQLCKISNMYKPDFVKTCTGTTGPVTVESITLMRKECLPEIKVKSSGGIHSFERVEMVLAAGAERIGTITAVDLVKQYREKYLS